MATARSSRSTAMAFYDAQNYKVVIIECGWYGIPGMLTLFCPLKPLFQGAKALTVLTAKTTWLK